MSAQDYDNKNAGGFINPKHGRGRVQKMKWTAENDRRLLLIGLGKEISPKEYAAIAESFKEKPTAKSIQERLTKLRQEQQDILGKIGLVGPSTKIHPVKDDDDQESSPFAKDSPLTDSDAANLLVSLSSGKTFTLSLLKDRPIDLTNDSPTVSGSTAAKKKRRVSSQKSSKEPRSSIPDPDEQLLPLEILRPRPEPLTEEEKRERKHAEHRRVYAKQVEREGEGEGEGEDGMEE